MASLRTVALLWAGVGGGTVTVLYLASLSCCNTGQCAAACFDVLCRALSPLSNYVWDTLSGLFTALFTAYKHIHFVWYILTGLTLTPLFAMPTKDIAVPFLAVYCAVALWLCHAVSSKPKPTAPRPNDMKSQFFIGVRI